MSTELEKSARRAIDALAERDGVPAEQIRMLIRGAIQAAQKDPSPLSELLWRTMTEDGNLPSPEQLIAWAADTIIQDEDIEPVV